MQQHSHILSYHTEVPSAWEAMLTACENAKHSIFLEEYILNPDEIGSRFIDVFKRRAKEGIEVRLLLDWWGCLDLRYSQQLQELEAAGVKVQFFREPSVKWLKMKPGFFPRDHRKLLIIDKEYAFIGGICLYDKITDWRDSMVRVNGAVTPQIHHVFENTWRKTLGDETQVKAHPDFETDPRYSIYANAPDSNENNFSEWLIEAIRNAKTSIKMTTPYFTPGDNLMPALKWALSRGVKVEIILSNYSKYATYVVGKHQCGELIRQGAEIYYYEPGMLHLKMMIIDDEVAAIGSCNLDGLSLYHNQEIMLVTTDEQAVSVLGHHFEQDRQSSGAFSYDDWRARPLGERISGYLLKPFRHQL